MVHGDHNKNRSGGFFLIILGALIFITSPLYLADSASNRISYAANIAANSTCPITHKTCFLRGAYEVCCLKVLMI